MSKRKSKMSNAEYRAYAIRVHRRAKIIQKICLMVIYISLIILIVALSIEPYKMAFGIY